MNSIRRIPRLAVALACLAATAAADVKVQEKTHFKFEGFLGSVVNVFGGKAAKEGVTSTVAISGDRRLRMSDTGGEIVDLREEKVYELDARKKTYSVTTFAELRRRFEEEQAKAAKEAKEREERERKDPKDDSAPQGAQMEVDFDVKETGQKRQVNGFDTRQAIVTVTLREKGRTLDQSGGLVVTQDMWLAPAIAGTQELARFEQRYAEKLYGPAAMAGARAQMAMLMATYPQLKEGLGRLQSETRKLEGTPVSTTMRIETVKSPAQMAAQEEEQPKGLGGMLGRKIGGLGKKDKEADGPKNRSTLMTTTYELLSVAPSASAADVAVPAGYQLKQ